LKILIVEDTLELAHSLKSFFRLEKNQVEIAVDLEEAKHFLSVSHFDMILLDITLPDGDGRDFLRALRNSNNNVPVIVMTARSEISDRIDLLDIGADDYIVKPFDLEELIARMKAVIRRSENSGIKDISLGNVIFNSTKNTFILNNKQLILTKLEMRLLETFVRRPHHIFERSYLIDKLYPLDTAVSPNAIELVVSRLRKKLSGSKIEIKTLRGLGYQAQEQEYD